MVRKLERKGNLSCEGSNLCRNGEGWCHGAQDSGFGRSKECEGPGGLGGRFAANQVPWTDGEAMGTKDGGDGIRADQRQGQPGARNCALDTGKVDGEGVAEGLQIREGR